MTRNPGTIACVLAMSLVACKAPTEAERSGTTREAVASSSHTSPPESALAGKDAIPAAAANPVVATLAPLTARDFDVAGLGKELGGWDHKSKTAAEYKSGGSNYRTYKPTVSPTPEGGLFISTKIDHIRGGDGDDHAQLEITFDRAGTVLDSKASLALDGSKKPLDTKLVTSAAALAGATAGTTAAVAVALEIFKALGEFVKTEHGGRANFPAVVRHNFNLIAAHVPSR